MPLVVVAAALLAYHNSFTGPFIFDDRQSIQENPTIRHLWPVWQPLSPPHWVTVDGRPIVNLSLAVNYAISGVEVQGYHALNLTIHILAGLTLFGVVRRTLLQPRLRERFGTVADELALAVAVLWTVHPLQTESVTYVIQRTESLMGLFFLLTLYCLIRGAESPRPRVWYGLCMTACALGMASKEVMVAAPLIVLLYDWVFLASSFREVWRWRTALYVGLAATWLILSVLVATTPRTGTGFGFEGLTPWDYLKTEAGVIVYYLRLSFWPHPLVIDYFDWPIAWSLKDSFVPGIVVAGLLGATVWAFRRRPWMGFLGAWFFLILAPTSSFLPSLGEAAAERRMYLPLAAVIVLVVVGIYTRLGRRSMPVFLVLAVGMGFLTVQRNKDYRSGFAIWADAVAKRPENPRAHYNLGVALRRADKVQEAIEQYEEALRIKPDYAEAHCNLGIVLTQSGRVPEAIEHLQHALRVAPDFPDAHCNLGIALAQAGREQEALGHFEQAVRIDPDYADAQYNLGVALEQAGRMREAVEHYEQAVRINPDYADVHYNLGLALTRLGRLPEAIEHYQQALRVQPDVAEVYYNLGIALAQAGRVPEGIEHLEHALRIKPDYAEAHCNLGIALAQAGRIPEAIEHLEHALRIEPDFTEAHYNLGVALAQAGRIPEAIAQHEQALRIKPDFTPAQNALTRLQARQ